MCHGPAGGLDPQRPGRVWSLWAGGEKPWPCGTAGTAGTAAFPLGLRGLPRNGSQGRSGNSLLSSLVLLGSTS